MNDSTTIDRLFGHWLTRFQSHQPISIDELCADRVDLITLLQARVDAYLASTANPPAETRPIEQSVNPDSQVPTID